MGSPRGQTSITMAETFQPPARTAGTTLRGLSPSPSPSGSDFEPLDGMTEKKDRKKGKGDSLKAESDNDTEGEIGQRQQKKKKDKKDKAEDAGKKEKKER